MSDPSARNPSRGGQFLLEIGPSLRIIRDRAVVPRSKPLRILAKCKRIQLFLASKTDRGELAMWAIRFVCALSGAGRERRWVGLRKRLREDIDQTGWCSRGRGLVFATAVSLRGRLLLCTGKKENMWAIAWRLQECRTQHCAYFTLENKATYPMFSSERSPVACTRTNSVSHKDHRMDMASNLRQSWRARKEGGPRKNTTITKGISRSGR